MNCRLTVNPCVAKNLELRKTCRLVPYHLTDDQKQVRLEASQNFVEMVDTTLNFFNCIVPEDESWCLQVRSRNETAKHGMAFSCNTSSEKGQIRKMTRTMLITFSY
ncbi:hypothetical protein TNCV_3736091 [Trichonephila clavipes]|nr:hypothetical protein TNCV_3736091 [Trichonephila clavipes]